jgi:hypothetical protein
LAENITSNSIILKAVAGCEYSLQNNGEWSENRVYTGLASATTYTFYQRYKDTENTEASDYTSSTITTSAESIDTPNANLTNLPANPDVSNNTSASAKTSKTGVAQAKGETITDTKSKAEYEVTSVSGKTPTVTYTKPGNKNTTTIDLPKTVKVGGVTYKVTAIADNAFKNCKNLKTVTISSNIVTIGKNVFSGDKKLKTIVIKTKKLTSKTVSKKAFAGVSNKVTIKVPKSKVKAYTKLFRSKGLSKKVKVRK